MVRNTTQREAIRHAFAHAGGPLSVEDVLRLGRQRVATLNQATVYRNLRMLCAEGLVRRLNHPELGPLYERTGTSHHHHFHCRVCDSVYELAGCALDVEGSTPEGFRTEDHEVFLYGICARCEARDTPDAGKD
jgi:Fur family ferric uptake transcriptional regulator